MQVKENSQYCLPHATILNDKQVSYSAHSNFQQSVMTNTNNYLNSS